ncbi:MAG: hypothetical protein P1U65_17525 [Minwuia sp.]|nr:hypothetical protein [Minwuia sp.]
MTEFSQQKVAHLAMIQATIGRMAGESARMKQFALASIAATASTAAATDTYVLAPAGAVLALLFWALDARYLAQERWFRAMYDTARQNTGAADFVMTPGEDVRAAHTVSDTMTGWSVFPLYMTLIVLSIAISLAIAFMPQQAGG